MKKVLALLGFVGFAFAANAQEGIKLSVGVDAGLPIGDFKETHKLGIGGTAKLNYGFSENLGVTLTTGYLSFSGKDFSGFKMPAYGIIPVKAGFAYGFTGGFYVEPQVGLSFINNGVGSAFTYAGNVGYKVSSVDISARYEAFSKNSATNSFVGLRVAYAFSLSGK